jgi:hypothetical protein
MEPFNTRTLTADLHHLELLLEQYKTISLDFRTLCFYEGGYDIVPDATVSKLPPHTTKRTSLRIQIVSESAAIPNELTLIHEGPRRVRSWPINQNHRDICKFSGPEDKMYKIVRDCLSQLSEDSGKLMKKSPALQALSG